MNSARKIPLLSEAGLAPLPASLEAPSVQPNAFTVFGEDYVFLVRERPVCFEEAEVFVEFRPSLWRG